VTPAFRLVSAGAGCVAVSFGLARYGYGLMLPDLRAALDLDSATLGVIGSGSFAAYLLATASCGLLAARVGARRLVIAGGALAVAGMLIVASAQSATALAAGIVVAGASSGLVYPPFADAVQQRLPEAGRPRALAIVSSGTGWGVLVSVPVALAAGADWRLAWVAFAALALLATLWAAVALRGTRAAATQEVDRLRPSWFVCPRSGPLLAGAFLIGLAASVYWTFSVDLAGRAGLGHDGARILLGVVGAASIAGSLGGDLLERIGGRAALVLGSLVMGTSLVLLAVAAGSWPAALASAAGFGAAYNLIVALQSIWSARVFADRPAVGIGAVMFVLSTGLLLGPPLAGAVADRVSLEAAFCGAGALCVAVTLLAPREELRSSAVPG